MTRPRIAVSPVSSAYFKKAEALARALHLPFIAAPQEAAARTYDYLLLLTPAYLGLQKLNEKTSKPFFIDFLSEKMRYRLSKASLRQEQLARSLGVSPQDHPVIVDATAGLGRDSFILAALGFRVTMLERSPLIFVLLQDALERATQDKVVAPIVERLQLIQADAIQWLKTLSVDCKPDLILLDPMFPKRKKSAAVKKEMILLQDLLEADPAETETLLRLALTCAKKRIVVKRPRLAANIADLSPNFSITGKSNRFDIYLTK